MHRVRVISAEIPVGLAVTGVGIIAGAFAVWQMYIKNPRLGAQPQAGEYFLNE